VCGASLTKGASAIELCLQRLQRMLRLGTTLVECKSGYGLETETEMKLLKVLHAAKSKTSIEIVANYLGAHSVPKGSSADEATDDIIKNQIPALKDLIAKGQISPELIDVFLEKGVFDQDQTKRILQAGLAAGLKLNFHGDEINYMGAGELGGELAALSISHLERVKQSLLMSLYLISYITRSVMPALPQWQSGPHLLFSCRRQPTFFAWSIHQLAR